MKVTWREFLLILVQIATISVVIFILLLEKGLKGAFYPGPPGGIEINLVGNQRIGLSGDKTTFMTEVKTTLKCFTLNKNF